MPHQTAKQESFAPNVAHDLLSPLCTISVIASYIREEFGDRLGESGVESVRLLEKSVARLRVAIGKAFPDFVGRDLTPELGLRRREPSRK